MGQFTVTILTTDYTQNFQANLPTRMGSKNGKPVLSDEEVKSLVSTSGMTDQQVRVAFDNFLAEHPDGKMNPEAFTKMMSLSLPDKDAAKMEKHVFRIYDENSDGDIDFVEFMVVLTIMTGGTPEQILKKIFRLFDVDSDGSISKKEMYRLVKDMYGLLKREDPKLSAANLVAHFTFEEMDRDEDGKVSMEEFVKACQSEEDLSKLLSTAAIEIFLGDGKSSAE